MADTIKIGQRVVLTADLTRYHPQLTVGSKGTLLDTKAHKEPWTDDARFGHVLHDQAGAWDVLWESLLPVPAVLDNVEDAQLLAEARRRGLLEQAVVGDSDAAQFLRFVADCLGPDLWAEMRDRFQKTRKTLQADAATRHRVARKK